MIIILTDSGNVYVNEKNIISIEHCRKKRVCFIRYAAPNSFSETTRKVQQIIYTTDAEKVTIKEDGNEIKDLKNAIKEQAEKYNNILKHSARLRSYVLKLMNYDSDLYDRINNEVIEEDNIIKERKANYRNEQADKSKPGD